MVAINKNMLSNAFHGVQNAAGNMLKNAGKGLNYITNPRAQEQADSKVTKGINDAYKGIALAFNRGIQNVEKATEYAIDGNAEKKSFAPYTISEDDSSNKQNAKAVYNVLAQYHQTVENTSADVAKTAGQKAHGLTHYAFSLVRIAAAALQIEVAGKLVQKSAALAVGFAVRALVRGIIRLGHLAPYAAAAAVVGGTITGLIALGHVSPLAAVGVAVALVLIGQQAQIIHLGNKVDILSKQIREQNKSLLSKIIANAPEKKTVAKAAAVAGLAALAALAAYTYGGNEAAKAAHYVTNVTVA